jgi:DNA-binding transcriptional ArsR family regulator
MTEDDLIEALKALAHPLRWKILATLATGERNVGDIESATGIAQPGLSQQLGVLRKAGLVDTRKHAKLVFYSLAQDSITEVNTAIHALAPMHQVSQEAAQTVRSPASGVANFARMS